MAYSLPALNYAYDALEPHIDAKTMQIHHTKHHQTYINNINAAIEGTEWEKLSVEDLVAKVHEVPSDLKHTVINNAWRSCQPQSVLDDHEPSRWW